MLRQPCVPIAPAPTEPPTEVPTEAQPPDPGISATILISGALQGRCIVHLSTASSARFTALLLGADTGCDQPIIDDAIRELCNMIAGGWKSRLGALASACQISVPAISHTAPPTLPDDPTVLRRLYAFAGSFLEVTLAL
jgi:chemotaxis protein CheX